MYLPTPYYNMVVLIITLDYTPITNFATQAWCYFFLHSYIIETIIIVLDSLTKSMNHEYNTVILIYL